MSVVTPGVRWNTRRRAFRTRLLGVVRVVVARLPMPVGNFIADRAGDLAYRVAVKSRLAAISNLRHVIGNDKTRLKKAVHVVFHNAMRNYYDLSRAPNLSDGDIDRMVDFDEDGWRVVKSLHEQGRGVILASAHFGGFDMMTQVMHRRGLPLTVLVAHLEQAWLSDFIIDLRASRDLNLLPLSNEEDGGQNLAALKRSIELLRKGELLGVVADRNMEHRGVTIRFFGYNTVVAAGVAKLAIRTGSVVVPTFCKRMPGNHYKLTIEEPIEVERSGSNDADIQALLTRLFARFERQIRRSPEQWVVLQPVWPDRVTSDE